MIHVLMASSVGIGKELIHHVMLSESVQMFSVPQDSSGELSQFNVETRCSCHWPTASRNTDAIAAIGCALSLSLSLSPSNATAMAFARSFVLNRFCL